MNDRYYASTVSNRWQYILLDFLFTNDNGKEMLGGQTKWEGWTDNNRKKSLD